MAVSDNLASLLLDRPGDLLHAAFYALPVHHTAPLTCVYRTSFPARPFRRRSGFSPTYAVDGRWGTLRSLVATRITATRERPASPCHNPQPRSGPTAFSFAMRV